MIEPEKLTEAVDIILENILTPIVYMYLDEVAEFIVFCDSNTSEEAFRETERIIYVNLGINVEITDLREFDESDRADIASNAFIVYSENELMPELFETAMQTDIEIAKAMKEDIITRKNDTGTYYIS